MIRTAQFSRTRPPRPCSARAMVCTAVNGSARASLGVIMPPFHSPWAAPMNSLISRAVNMRESRSLARATSIHCSNSASSAADSVRPRMPPRRKPMPSPSSAWNRSQIARLSLAMGTSSGSRHMVRTQPQLRLDCSPATRPLSQTSTERPRSRRNQAVDTPITPPPTITTSTVSGSGSWKWTGLWWW